MKMTDFFRFFSDVITLTLLLTIMTYQFFLVWVRRNKNTFVESIDFLVVVGGIAALIFMRSTIWSIFGGHLFPGILMEIEALNQISLSISYLIGSLLLIFSFRLLSTVLQFDMKFKLLKKIYNVLLVFVFIIGLSVLIYGVDWYHSYTYYVCLSLYALAFLIQCFISLYSLFIHVANRTKVTMWVVIGIEILFIYLVVTNFTPLHFFSIPLGGIALFFHMLISTKENRDFQQLLRTETKSLLTNNTSPRLSDINETDRAVAELLLKGFLYKEIAEKVGISVSSVRKRVHFLYQKYEVQNRTELFIFLNRVEQN